MFEANNTGDQIKCYNAKISIMIKHSWHFKEKNQNDLISV